MSLLIGIKSCQRDRMQGFHKAIRETWGRDLGSVPIRFFVGDGWTTLEATYEDEIHLDCPDDYRSLPFKTKAILTWFLETNHDHIFLCDNDTFVIPRLLLAQPYAQYDYAGKISSWPAGVTVGQTFRYDDGQGNIHEQCYSWASGGYGYFVSRKAAEAIIKTEPCSWAEDLWVGQVMGPMIASGQVRAADLDLLNRCTWHFQKHVKPFEVSEIREAYQNGQPTGLKWSVR